MTKPKRSTRHPDAVKASRRWHGYQQRPWWQGYYAGEGRECATSCPYRGDPVWSASRNGDERAKASAWRDGHATAVRIKRQAERRGGDARNEGGRA